MRALVRILGILGLVVGVFAVLWITGLLVPLNSGGASSMAPTIPACNGRVLAEGLTYKRRDPHRGEIVAFHASGTIGGPVTPDAESRDLALQKRVVAIPGDQVVGRDGYVYVNGFKIDDIQTKPFPRVDVGAMGRVESVLSIEPVDDGLVLRRDCRRAPRISRRALALGDTQERHLLRQRSADPLGEVDRAISSRDRSQRSREARVLVDGLERLRVVARDRSPNFVPGGIARQERS